MIAGSNKKIRLQKNANYLKDVFSTSPYIELGNIDYMVMDRINNFEKVDIEEITDFRLQNSNVTNFKINDKELQNILPYMFLSNINKKNKSMQIFLTYGLLSYKNTDGMELFAPIILIPVNLYFEEQKIFIQKFSRPIVNTILNNELEKTLSVERKKLISLSITEKFNTLHSMDKYILSMSSLPGLDVKLENYLTIGESVEKDIKINHNRFPITRAHENYLIDRYYQRKDNLNFVFPLNKKQREALLNAEENNNFVIVGRMGTGKTTTLINICLEKIKDGNRVLYVSNQNETLNQVYNFFEEKHLENYAINFSNSFSSFYFGEASLYNKEIPVTNDNIANLLEKYKQIKNYEKMFYSRLLDNRYLEVQNELVLLSLKGKKLLEIDDLSKLYKTDYLAVVKSLKLIEKNRKVINYIADSKWKEIPLTNRIKNRKNVLNLIYAIHRAFKILDSEKQVLEEDFGIVKILNLAMLRNVVRTIKRLSVGDVPESWKKINFEKYYKAEKLYPNLKDDISKLQELEYHIENVYQDLDKILINSEIDIALGENYQEEDFEKIDQIFSKRKELVLIANKASYNKELLENNLKVIQKALNIKLDLNVYNITFLIELSEFLGNVKISQKQVHVAVNKNKNYILKEIIKINEEYVERLKEINVFEQDYPGVDFEKLDNYLTIFKTGVFTRENKKILSIFIKDKRRFNQKLYVKEIINRIENVNNSLIIINKLKKKYFDFTNLDIDEFEDDYTNISLISDYLDSLKDTLYFKNVVSFFKDNNRIGKKAFNRTRNSFSIFLVSYKEYFNIHAIYKNYGFNLSEEFTEFYYEIININNYLQKVFSSNDRVATVVKDDTLDYISFKTYLDIRDSKNAIISITDSLKLNDDYREIYGEMYNEGLTNINAISRVIQNFGNYIKCFIDDKNAIETLKIDINFKLSNHLNRCLEVSDEINTLFQHYSKVFKFGVTKFLYADYSETIDYMSDLLKSEEELIAYLNIVDGLQVIYDNNLNKLADYILFLKEEDTLVNDFKYTYFSNLQNLFLEKYENINNYLEIEEKLKEVVVLEKEIIKDNTLNIVNEIRKNTGNKFSIHNINELDYKAYLHRTKNIKNLVLAPTSIVNHYLDINEFDLVIIDDAHLLDANEYNEAIKGKQVIICGELQLQSVASNNLISRMRSNSIINMNYRFIPTPKNLLNYMEGSLGLIKNTFSSNKGIKVITNSILDFVTNLYINNDHVLINIFSKGFNGQKEIYEELTNLFIENDFSKNKIIDIFANKLNVVDLSIGYLYHSDYNIIYLEDYYDVDSEPLVNNMIDYLLLCKEKLIIYDNKGYLEQIDSGFVNILNKIVNSPEKWLFNDRIVNKSVVALGKLLISKGYNAFPGHDELSLTLEKNDKLYGVLLFSDYMRNNYEMLNEYRDYYNLFIKRDFNVIIAWINSEENNLDEIANKIIKEITDGENNK